MSAPEPPADRGDAAAIRERQAAGGEAAAAWAERARRTDTWEIQLHPPVGRGRVRTLRVTRNRRQAAAVALGAAALAVALGLALLPGAWRDLESPHPQGAAGTEQAREARRLQALVQRLEELLPRSKDVRFEAQKLVLAYDLEAGGDGGATPPTADPDGNQVAHGEWLVTEVQRELARAASWAEEVEAYQQAHPDDVRLTPSIRPLGVDSDSFVLISGFGERTDPFTGSRDLHAGIDLAASEGTPVVATADGAVTFAGSFPAGPGHRWWRFGNLVVLSHGDGFLTLYGHCQELLVRAGQRVARGERIATVGSTGWSVVPHLHYEVRRREGGALRPLDPRLFILDQRWGDPDRLLAVAAETARLPGFEPLPPRLVD